MVAEQLNPSEAMPPISVQDRHLQRGLVQRPWLASDAARCEPPLDCRTHTYHWLARDGGDPVPCRWDDHHGDQTGLVWYPGADTAGLSAAFAHYRGWRYRGPAIPPERKGADPAID